MKKQGDARGENVECWMLDVGGERGAESVETREKSVELGSALSLRAQTMVGESLMPSED